MYIIQYRDLRTNNLTLTSINRLLQFYFNHMASRKPAAFGHTVD